MVIVITNVTLVTLDTLVMGRTSIKDPGRQKYTISVTTSAAVFEKLRTFCGDNFTRNLGTLLELLDSVGIFDEAIDHRSRVLAERSRTQLDALAVIRESLTSSRVVQPPAAPPVEPPPPARDKAEETAIEELFDVFRAEERAADAATGDEVPAEPDDSTAEVEEPAAIHEELSAGEAQEPADTPEPQF